MPESLLQIYTVVTFQLLEDVPQIPYRGSAPGPRWGTAAGGPPSPTSPTPLSFVESIKILKICSELQLSVGHQ